MRTTTQRLSVTHPYQGIGIALIVVSLILIGIGIGVFARCGNEEGVCFDVATHGTSDGALVGFFVLFVIGVALAMYSAGSVAVTRTESPPAAPPQVTVVSAPASPPATVVTVNPPAASPPPATVTVNSR
jgi:hypothetical protein